MDIEASGGGGLEQPLPVADSFELRLSTKAEIPLTLFNSRERSDFRDKLLRKNTLGISVGWFCLESVDFCTHAKALIRPRQKATGRL